MSIPPRTRILVVDDDLSLRVLTTIILAREGLSPTAVGSVPRALDRMTESPVDAVLTDLVMPCLDGLDLIRALRRSSPETPVVAMSGSDDELVGRALALGARSVVRKPFTREELVGAIRDALGERRAAA